MSVMKATMTQPMRSRPAPGWAAFLILALAAGAGMSPAAAGGSGKSVGIVQVIHGERFLVDSSWIVANDRTRWKGKARHLDRLRTGMFVTAQGQWNDAGDFVPLVVKVKRSVPGSSYRSGLLDQGRGEVASIAAKEGLLFDDPEVIEFVQRIGNRVIPVYAQANPDFQIRFHVLNNPHMNAFALPTGDIYVHTGLLAKIDSEDQLASILGHEVAHVTEHHMERHMKSTVMKTSIFQVGALAMDVAVDDGAGSAADSTIVNMVGLGLNLGYMAAISGFGRDLEDQADRVGLLYVYESGYNPREAPAVWDIFSSHYGDTPTVVNFFYSDHSTNSVRQQTQETEIERHYSGLHDWSDAERRARRVLYQRAMLDLIRKTAVEDFENGQKQSARSGFEKVLMLSPEDPVASDYLRRLRGN
jgi:predicted Zn-dependent protease